MKIIWKTLNLLSSLKVAISLLFIIAISSGIGTAIPQGEISSIYLNKYQDQPWLGIINGNILLKLQLDHVYSSFWFLLLLFWLASALIICTFRRQWPSLKSAIKWVDYNSPKQILKLAVSETISTNISSTSLKHLADYLNKKGWQIKQEENSLSARKGVIGRFGPPLVHLGLILLMIGATLGAIKGQRIERFIPPGESIDLISPSKQNKLSLKLQDFSIKRSPNGQPEQFTSSLQLNNQSISNPIYEQISVNHPLRYNGITIYQADWSLSSIKIAIGSGPKLQLPLTLLPELGDQVWGVILPSKGTDTGRILITATNEDGPIKAFNEKGELIGFTRVGGKAIDINGIEINLIEILPSSGILIKYDPGVPLVYIGFAITLIGSMLSIISTKLLWAIVNIDIKYLYIGGLSNRNLSGFSKEFPAIIEALSKQ